MPRLPLPSRGIADATAVVDTPADFTRPTGMVNVRPHQEPDGTMSFGPRPAVVKKFSTELAGPVQAMTVVPKTGGVTGLATGDFKKVVGGKTRVASLLRGHMFVTDSQFGLETALVNLDGDVDDTTADEGARSLVDGINGCDDVGSWCRHRTRCRCSRHCRGDCGCRIRDLRRD